MQPSTALHLQPDFRVKHSHVAWTEPPDRKPCVASDEVVETSVDDSGKPEAPELLPDFGAASAGLPELSEYRRKVWEYYWLTFLPDGYPGKLSEKGVIRHPIYPSYVLLDYLLQYGQTKDQRFLDGARKVADAAISLAYYDSRYDSLMMFYSEEDALTIYPGKFISGLTQVRYLVPLFKLSVAVSANRVGSHFVLMHQ